LLNTILVFNKHNQGICFDFKRWYYCQYGFRAFSYKDIFKSCRAVDKKYLVVWSHRQKELIISNIYDKYHWL